jgi:hypothetical protein
LSLEMQVFYIICKTAYTFREIGDFLRGVFVKLFLDMRVEPITS